MRWSLRATRSRFAEGRQSLFVCSSGAVVVFWRMGSEDLSGALMSSGWMRFLPLSVGLAIMAASVDAELGQLFDEHWLTGEDRGRCRQRVGGGRRS